MRQGGALGVFYILQQTTRCAQAARGVLYAKTDKIAGTELQVQLLASGVNFKLPQRAATQTATAFNQRLLGKVFRIQQFCGISALEFSGHGIAVCRFAQAKTSGADIEGGIAEAFAILPDGGQQVVLTFLQQCFIADSARGDDANDFTFDRSFGGGRVANLFANRDRFALVDQLRQIVFHRVMRDPGHRDRFTG
ncbi:Uncharacterised protein [Yokenella regensburgei]|uniref:Uncharacterized protein n=1 Tax=Yokenella regensburgei TaxID=158877 RepID=A0AB38FWB4_9ENTR|nr:Uncharacterised protein [Yokenella regensburgei]